MEIFERDFVEVELTRHFIERMFERVSSKVKKFDEKTLVDIVTNIVRNGMVYVSDDGRISIFTGKYMLGGVLREGRIVLRTVYTPKVDSLRFRFFAKRAVKSPWKNVLVMNLKSVRAWIRKLLE